MYVCVEGWGGGMGWGVLGVGIGDGRENAWKGLKALRGLHVCPTFSVQQTQLHCFYPGQHS